MVWVESLFLWQGNICPTEYNFKVSRGVVLAPTDQASELGKYREWKRGEKTLSVSRQKTDWEKIWMYLNLYSHNELYSTYICVYYNTVNNGLFSYY